MKFSGYVSTGSKIVTGNPTGAPDLLKVFLGGPHHTENRDSQRH